MGKLTKDPDTLAPDPYNFLLIYPGRSGLCEVDDVSKEEREEDRHCPQGRGAIFHGKKRS